MYSCSKLSFKRLSSSLAFKRAPFYEVFPSKKLVNRLLFEMDSKLTFSKLYPVYESVYNSLDVGHTERCFPVSFKGEDVMMMKKVLEKLRHRTKSVNRNLRDLENELLENAAELGDNDAISVLSFNVITNSDKNTPEDVSHAQKLIKSLYQMHHPLTIKLTADFAFASEDFSNAEKYYKLFLDSEKDTYRAGEVNGQLGKISFKKPDLKEAEKYFLESIRLCPLEQVVQSYYHLAQLYMDSEPVKARCLMESAASEGFKESFQLLGFLEMNYFQNLQKALQWFKLGMELFDFECFIGYFDCCMKLKSFQKAKNCLKSMQKLSETNEVSKESFQIFVNSRHDQINSLALYSKNVVADTSLFLHADRTTTDSPIEKESRWNL
ncbi:LAME_0E04676g1_1 [Lachancea meyersii CBS 8951]|uniref:LAME_0E04676g1_1 n=1 Tax=Lachancea meyersii CBS 8951 TaxID=1266667 RepID=A0A1G4JH60_9SACH|nr:LAME_0E04676g1_1 [Lachancea meyersii CBS 8951]